MTDHPKEKPGEGGGPVPRDLPDQQAQEGKDHWDVTPADPGQSEGTDEDATDPDTEIPDTDEAGTGRQGAPRSGTVHPEHPGPEESPA
ncbi:hypothetical protein [Streptomyces sp. NPDC050704]|uniref:hypothetical protein n=1 Tax=Streptomyces sp. NPDC050704 TaxID=3157219 RepID=UPI0034231029